MFSLKPFAIPAQKSPCDVKYRNIAINTVEHNFKFLSQSSLNFVVLWSEMNKVIIVLSAGSNANHFHTVTSMKILMLSINGSNLSSNCSWICKIWSSGCNAMLSDCCHYFYNWIYFTIYFFIQSNILSYFNTYFIYYIIVNDIYTIWFSKIIQCILHTISFCVSQCV